MLDEKVIKEELCKFYPKMPIYIYKSTDSTNTRAKEVANNGYNQNAVFMADTQTAGRGRIGRRFISEEEKGLYLSILLGSEHSQKSGLAITTYMAVIASRVIEKLSPLSVKIKWVNDIFAGGKKVSGILTEGKTNADTGKLEYTVCGIGINVLNQGFDSEVKNIATSIEDECGIKLDISVLAVEIIRDFFDNLHLVGTTTISEEYKKRSFIIGKRVDVIKPAVTYKATVLDITNDCALLLQTNSGEREILFTGEVSIKVD